MQAIINGVRGAVCRNGHSIGETLFRVNHPAFGAINHSCKPTATVVDERVISIQTMIPGDEITVDFIEHQYCGSTCNRCGSSLNGHSTRCKNVHL